MRSVVGAVLAAGAGARMGTPKAGLVVGGSRLLDRAVAALHGAGCAPLVAVVRAGTDVRDARAVVNPEPDRGMRSSLALAVDAAENAAGDAPGGVDGGVDALAVLLVDLPGVSASACAAVIAAWRPGRVTVAAYTGAAGPGHPIVMSPSMWRDALVLAGPDEGARAYLRAHPGLIDAVPVPGDPRDLDTPDDLRRWRDLAGQ